MKSKIAEAEAGSDKLIYDLKNTWRVPLYFPAHAQEVVDNYRTIVHDLLIENKILKEDLEHKK